MIADRRSLKQNPVGVCLHEKTAAEAPSLHRVEVRSVVVQSLETGVVLGIDHTLGDEPSLGVVRGPGTEVGPTIGCVIIVLTDSEIGEGPRMKKEARVQYLGTAEVQRENEEILMKYIQVVLTLLDHFPALQMIFVAYGMGDILRITTKGRFHVIATIITITLTTGK